MKSVLALMIILICNSSFGQNTGLYGKRNYLEFNLLGNVPVFNWWIRDNPHYKKLGSQSLTEGRDILNNGFRLAFGHAGKKRTGVGIEFGMDYQDFAGPEYGYYYFVNDWGYDDSRYITIKHQAVRVQTMTIMPKLEFTSKGANLPVGINHQIGIGYTSSKLMDKDYIMIINQYDATEFQTSADSANFVNNFVDYDFKHKGFTFLYNFNIKTPVSKKVMINYGIRYTFHVKNPFQDYTVGYRVSGWGTSEVGRLINRHRMTNFLTFNLGASYSF
jgi:hypothetical protein